MRFLLIILSSIFYRAAAQSIELKYDSLNRITQITYAEQATIKYTYDKNGNRVSQAVTSLKCNFDNASFIANSIRQDIVQYQWQVDTGNEWTNIFDGSIYQGTNTNVLHLTQAPTNWYGHIYQCIVTYADNTTFTTPPAALKFTLNWSGIENTAWENPTNWNCGIVPDENTDVFINQGKPNYPVVNVNAKCRSLKIHPGSFVTVKDGVTLSVMGK